jgi:hypothetical protein
MGLNELLENGITHKILYFLTVSYDDTIDRRAPPNAQVAHPALRRAAARRVRRDLSHHAGYR